MIRCAIYRGPTPSLAVTCCLLLYCSLVVCSPSGTVVSSLYLIVPEDASSLQASLSFQQLVLKMRDDFGNARNKRTVFATVYQYLYQKKVPENSLAPLFKNNIFDNF